MFGTCHTKHNLPMVIIRNVVLLLDEMKIREDLVFDRSGAITGFVNTGEINDSIKSLEAKCSIDGEEELATHMLSLMVQGIFVKLEHPIGHFSTNGVY